MEIKLQRLGRFDPKLGAAENDHLVLDPERKEYLYFKDSYVGDDFANVARKSDLLDLLEKVRKEGWIDKAKVRDEFPEVVEIQSVGNDEYGNPDFVVSFLIRCRAGLDVERAITDAVSEWLDSDDGKIVRKRLGNVYDWGDFANDPPSAEICAKHGFVARVMDSPADRTLVVRHDCGDMEN